MGNHNWTANPKEQFYNGSKNTFEINIGEDGECVAEVVHGLDNAKLMAAAPELLEACNQVMYSYKKDGQLLNFNIDIIRVAINKATGGDHGTN